MRKKKLNKAVEEEIPLYASIKSYIHEKTMIDYNYIEALTAIRISNNSVDVWDDFSIVFKDLSTKKIFRLENERLSEENK